MDDNAGTGAGLFLALKFVFPLGGIVLAIIGLVQTFNIVLIVLGVVAILLGQLFHRLDRVQFDRQLEIWASEGTTGLDARPPRDVRRALMREAIALEGVKGDSTGQYKWLCRQWAMKQAGGVTMSVGEDQLAAERSARSPAMDPPSPVAMDSSHSRLVRERGRAATSKRGREEAVHVTRVELSRQKPRVEPTGMTGNPLADARFVANRPLVNAQDTLVCNLLSYSAFLLESGDLHAAEAALNEASSIVSEITALFESVSHDYQNDSATRTLILAASVFFNSAVLYYLAGIRQEMLEALTNATGVVENIPQELRQMELYETLEGIVASEFLKFDV